MFMLILVWIVRCVVFCLLLVRLCLISFFIVLWLLMVSFLKFYCWCNRLVSS